MANMIQSLGRDWFVRRCNGAHFLLDGKVVRLDDVGARKCSVVNIENEDRAEVPFDFFTGFKVFAYPGLGYRKFGAGLAAFLTKHHSYNRGLRHNCVQVEYSPVTTILVGKFGRALGKAYQGMTNEEKMKSVFLPTFNKPQDVNKLLEGELPTVVLNQDILIEPNVAKPDAEDYIIYFRNRPCGTINDRRKINWFNPEYGKAISAIVRPEGSW